MQPSFKAAQREIFNSQKPNGIGTPQTPLHIDTRIHVGGPPTANYLDTDDTNKF